MNRDEILSMKPGRELDRLIGEHIFGYKNILNVADYWFIDDLNTSLPHYSTDIAAAWEVVEMFSYIDIHRYDDFFACAIYPIGSSAVIRARGKTMPEAICKAALLAVMDGEDEHERD